MGINFFKIVVFLLIVGCFDVTSAMTPISQIPSGHSIKQNIAHRGSALFSSSFPRYPKKVSVVKNYRKPFQVSSAANFDSFDRDFNEFRKKNNRWGFGNHLDNSFKRRGASLWKSSPHSIWVDATYRDGNDDSPVKKNFADVSFIQTPQNLQESLMLIEPYILEQLDLDRQKDLYNYFSQYLFNEMDNLSDTKLAECLQILLDGVQVYRHAENGVKDVAWLSWTLNLILSLDSVWSVEVVRDNINSLFFYWATEERDFLIKAFISKAVEHSHDLLLPQTLDALTLALDELMQLDRYDLVEPILWRLNAAEFWLALVRTNSGSFWTINLPDHSTQMRSTKVNLTETLGDGREIVKRVDLSKYNFFEF